MRTRMRVYESCWHMCVYVDACVSGSVDVRTIEKLHITNYSWAFRYVYITQTLTYLDRLVGLLNVE